jgi:DNA processing protein
MVGLILIIVSRLAGLVLPGASKYLMDDVIAKGDVYMLKVVLIAVALLARLSPLAVIPSALDRVTPVAHVALAARIVRSGALVSEVGEGGPFGRGAFVRRNRIIAALAAATVVVEAGEESGALATAAFARALGRAVLAVPGDVDRPGAQGTLSLLRQGARPCADAADVLASMPAATGEPVTPESRLEAALGTVPRDVTALAEASGAGVADTLARLLRLQWSGIAVSHPGGRWSRRGG